MSHIATAIFVVGILGLFALDRDRKAPSSLALWLPVAWLLIVCSRPISVWLATAGIGGVTAWSNAPGQYLEGSPLDRDVYTALLIIGLVVLVGRGRQVVTILRSNGAILLFFLYCAASLMWSDYPDVALKRWIKSLGDLVMVLIVLTDRDRIAAIKRVLARVGFLLIPLSVLTIKYYPALARYYDTYEGTQRFSGIAQDKNMLGIICLIFGLAAWWRLLQELRGSRNLAKLAAQGSVLFMAFWLFHKANSMTSLSCFALAAGLIVVAGFSRVGRKRAVVHLLVLAAVLVCFSTLFVDRSGGVLTAMGRNPTLTGRTEIWKLVPQVSGNPLVGTGFESFWLGDRLEKLWTMDNGLLKGINEAHNGYLEMYLNLGWIGVGLLAILILGGYRNVMTALRRDRQAGSLQLAYFTVAVIYSFTEAGFRMLNPVWIMFLFAIMAVPARVAPEAQPSKDAVEEPGWTAAELEPETVHWVVM